MHHHADKVPMMAIYSTIRSKIPATIQVEGAVETGFNIWIGCIQVAISKLIRQGIGIPGAGIDSTRKLAQVIVRLRPAKHPGPAYRFPMRVYLNYHRGSNARFPDMFGKLKGNFGRRIPVTNV